MPRFSQRYGHKDLPPQLKLGVISESFRSRVKLALDRLVSSSFKKKYYSNIIGAQGIKYFQDLWIKELSSTEEIGYNLENLDALLGMITHTEEFHEVFDLIEFTFEFTKNQNFIDEVTQAFSDERLAYRIRNAEVVAVGTEEQAVTINKAHDHLEKIQAKSAKSHLHQASRLLAQGDFGGSVRESISAVESVARKIEPDAGSLGKALNLINKNPDFNIHSSLNEAFKKIYGYTSDTEGIA